MFFDSFGSDFKAKVYEKDKDQNGFLEENQTYQINRHWVQEKQEVLRLRIPIGNSKEDGEAAHQHRLYPAEGVIQ